MLCVIGLATVVVMLGGGVLLAATTGLPAPGGVVLIGVAFIAVGAVAWSVRLRHGDNPMPVYGARCTPQGELAPGRDRALAELALMGALTADLPHGLEYWCDTRWSWRSRGERILLRVDAETGELILVSWTPSRAVVDWGVNRDNVIRVLRAIRPVRIEWLDRETCRALLVSHLPRSVSEE